MPKFRFSGLVHTNAPADDIKAHMLSGWENVHRVLVINQGGPALRFVSVHFKAETPHEALAQARDLASRMQHPWPADSFRLGGKSLDQYERDLEPEDDHQEPDYYPDPVDQEAHYERFGRPAFPNEY